MLTVDEVNEWLWQYRGHVRAIEWRTAWDFRDGLPRLDVRIEFARDFHDEDFLVVSCRNVDSGEMAAARRVMHVDQVMLTSEKHRQLEQIRFTLTNSGQDADPFTLRCKEVIVAVRGREEGVQA